MKKSVHLKVLKRYELKRRNNDPCKQSENQKLVMVDLQEVDLPTPLINNSQSLYLRKLYLNILYYMN